MPLGQLRRPRYNPSNDEDSDLSNSLGGNNDDSDSRGDRGYYSEDSLRLEPLRPNLELSISKRLKNELISKFDPDYLDYKEQGLLTLQGKDPIYINVAIFIAYYKEYVISDKYGL